MKRANIGKGWSVTESLKWATESLSFYKVPDPYIEAEYLLAHLLGCQRKELLIHPERVLTGNELERFRSFIERRGRREPAQYITGEVEFRGLLFKVNRDVLIPRPETELLVEEVVETTKSTFMTSHRKQNEAITILDLCTGSGCIAISLTKELPASQVFAVDISAGAIAVARENTRRHGAEERVVFLAGDLFEAINHLGLEGKIDLIVSNPPYVSKREMEGLQPEIKNYEPMHALYGGEDGLDFYRRIIHEAPNYLAPGGSLIMEIGYGQAESISGLFKKEGAFNRVEVKKDLSGIERIINGYSLR